MRFNKKYLAVILVTLVMFTGCENVNMPNKKKEDTSLNVQNISGLVELEAVTKNVDDITFSEEPYLDKECRKMYKLLMMSQVNKNVTYKKEDIIDGIRAVNVGNSLMPMSRVVTIDNLKKYLPVENVKKIETKNNVTFLIEYPMEDCTFVVVANQRGVIRGTYMQAKKLRSGAEMSLLFEGMRLEDVNRIYPEIIISPTGNRILSEDISTEEFVECDVALKNGRKATVCFRQAGNGYEVSEVTFTDDLILSKEEWKIIYGNDGSTNQKETGLVLLENKIIQGENLWNDFVLKSKMKEPCSITVKHYYIDNVGVSRMTLYFDGEFYSTSELIKGEQGKKYRCLVELSGQLPNAKYKEHGYYLVHDNSVTYNELMWSIFSSQSSDYIDFYMIYSEHE